MSKTTQGSLVKLLSLLLAAILLTSLLPGEILAAGVNSLTESLNSDSWLENNAIHVDVSKKSGAFYIRTVAGDKLVKGDENASLLWPSEDDTSFTTVRITRGGVTRDYIFGKNYGEAGNPVTVTNDGTRISAVWTVDSVTFTQNIELQPTNNDAHGMVAISYTAVNAGEAADIDLRILLDTAMGGKDSIMSSRYCFLPPSVRAGLQITTTPVSSSFRIRRPAPCLRSIIARGISTSSKTPYPLAGFRWASQYFRSALRSMLIWGKGILSIITMERSFPGMSTPSQKDLVPIRIARPFSRKRAVICSLLWLSSP